MAAERIFADVAFGPQVNKGGLSDSPIVLAVSAAASEGTRRF